MAAGVAIADHFSPVPGESWGDKLTRTRTAITHPVRPVAEHTRELGDVGNRPRFKRK